MTKTKTEIAVLTSCSVSRNYDPILRIQDAPECKTMRELCDWWLQAMNAVDEEEYRTPGEIYSGQAFDTVTEIAQIVGHKNVFIVTGGMGLTRHTTAIVPYDFTSDKKATYNAHQKVTGEKFLPHVWWEMINTGMGRNQAPIAKDLLGNYDVVIGALPKAFAKYIVGDLRHIGEEDLRKRIFIPISRSSITSIPQEVRDAFVPYDQQYANTVAYTRNNKQHKVVQKFLAEGLAAESFHKYAEDIMATPYTIPSSKLNELDYDQLFKDHPELLEFGDVGSAIAATRRLGYKPGGRHRFAGAWRGAKGKLEGKASKRAVKALKSLIEKRPELAESGDDELLEHVGIFIAAVREVNPSMVFTASDIIEWAKEVLDLEEGSPMLNTTKLTYLLQYNHEYLGLERTMAGSRQAFKIES